MWLKFIDLDMNWIYCSHKVCSDIGFDTVRNSSCVWRTPPLGNLLNMQISSSSFANLPLGISKSEYSFHSRWISFYNCCPFGWIRDFCSFKIKFCLSKSFIYLKWYCCNWRWCTGHDLHAAVHARIRVCASVRAWR